MDFQMMTSLPAADIDRARTWYAEVLGLEPSIEMEGGGSLLYMTDGGNFMVYQSEFAGTNKATAAALAVADMDAAMASLRSSGVTFEDIAFGDMATDDGVMTFPNGQRMAWFKDSEGNIFGIGDSPM